MLNAPIPLLLYCGFALSCAFWLLAPNSFITDPADIVLAGQDAKLKKQTHLAYAVSLACVLASVLMAGRVALAWEPTVSLLLALVVLAFLLRARKARLPFPAWLSWFVGGALAVVCSWWLPVACGSLLFLALGLGTERRKLTLLGAAGVVGCVAVRALFTVQP